MDQINQLEDEMKNQLFSTNIDVKNLQEEHNYNTKETHTRYENTIKENINEHIIKEKKLLVINIFSLFKKVLIYHRQLQ
jgi:hypothetical protein